MSVSSELQNAPFPEIIRNVGVGIAEAQYELDLVSMKIARMMAGFMPEEEQNGAPRTTSSTRNLVVDLGDGRTGGYSLLELGFTPTFYQYVDTLIELKMSISMTRNTEARSSRTAVSSQASGRVGFFSARGQVSATVVSARFSSKFQYSAEGSSLVRTKLVPVPSPSILEERIRAMIQGSTQQDDDDDNDDGDA